MDAAQALPEGLSWPEAKAQIGTDHLCEWAENAIAPGHWLLPKLALKEMLRMRGFPSPGSPMGDFLSHLQPETAN